MLSSVSNIAHKWFGSNTHTHTHRTRECQSLHPWSSLLFSSLISPSNPLFSCCTLTVLLHSHQTLWFLVSFDTSIYQSFFNSLPSSSHLYAPIFLPLIMNCSWCILFLLLFLCPTLSYPSLWLPVQGYTLPKPSTTPDLVYQAKFLCFSCLPSPAWTMRKEHCAENLL